MRPIESYFVYLSLIAPYPNFLSYFHPLLPSLIAISLLVVLFLHFILEFPRYQFALLYPSIIFTSSLLLLSEPITWFWYLIFTALTWITAAVACIIPVAKLPPLKGKWKTIGVNWIYLKETEEKMKKRDGMKARELVIKVLYPASIESPSKSAKFAAYTNSSVAGGTARFIHFPSFVFSHLPLSQSHTQINLPIASPPSSSSSSKKFPVVLFSHGLGGHPDIYTIYAEELASHGYIVILPTHNDLSASISQLPDRRTINYRFLTSQELAAPFDESHTRHQQLLQRSDEMSFLLEFIFESGNWLAKGAKIVNRDGSSPSSSSSSRDSHFLTSLSSDLLDLSKVCAGGHSFGAATAIHLTAHENHPIKGKGKSRIKAVFSHDQWFEPLHPQLLEDAVGKTATPILMTVSDQFYNWLPNMNMMKALHTAALKHSLTSSHLLRIKNTRHSNFCDIGIFSSMIAKKAKAIGTADVKKTLELLNDYNVTFLNKKLDWLGGVEDEEGKKNLDHSWKKLMDEKAMSKLVEFVKV